MMLGLLSLPLMAQSNFATIEGRIEDPSHQAVSGARVEVRSKATGAVRVTATNESGLFEVASLPPAEYSVQAQAPGFSPLVREVMVEVGQHMTLDLALSVTEKRETVAVTATAETLKTQDASLGEVVESKSVENLPLNGRMLLDLALTVPGAHLGHGAQTGDMSALYWRPGQRSAITIGGNRPNANYFLLDGATNTDPTFNTMNLSPSPDQCRSSRYKPAAIPPNWAAQAAARLTSSPGRARAGFTGQHTSSSAMTHWMPAPGTKCRARAI